jgi:hypothetical protein
MSASLERLEAHIRAVEDELARDVAEQQQRWRYRVHAGRVWFDDEARRAHARLRQSIAAYIREGSVLSLITAPVIYSLIVPLAVLDLWVYIYQWACFSIYGIARVRRRALLCIRPTQARLPERDREGQLHVLQLRQRPAGVRA